MDGNKVTTSMWRPITTSSIKCVNAMICSFLSFLRSAVASDNMYSSFSFYSVVVVDDVDVARANRHFVSQNIFALHSRLSPSPPLSLRFSFPFIETLRLMTRRQTLILHFY